jgi:TrmH family RNA methyltransferase
MQISNNVNSESSAPLKLIKKISLTKGSIEHNLCLVEGWKCFDEAIQKVNCREVILTNDLVKEFKHKYKLFDKPIHLVEKNSLKKISHLKTPEGIIGIFNRPSISTIIPSPKAGELHLGLFNWSDPNNIGAVMRTARGLAIASVTLFGNGPDFYSPKVIRTSMGSVFHLNINNVEQDTPMDSKHWEIFAAEADGEDSLEIKCSTEKSNMLFIGNETHGFSGELPKNSRKVAIKLSNQLESLSAPIAASLLLDRLKR